MATLTVAGQIFIIACIGAFAFRKRGFAPAIRLIGRSAVYLALCVVVGAALGSFLFSYVGGLEPCVLCWYQRVFLFPQVVLLAIALWKRDHEVTDYALALSGIGATIALYHSYLQIGGTPLVPCSVSPGAVSCAHRYVFEFGYVTLPLMSLTAFGLVIVLMIARKISRV